MALLTRFSNKEVAGMTPSEPDDYPFGVAEFFFAIDQAEQAASNLVLPYEQAMAWAAIAHAYAALV